jgi:hypothetical protein
MKIKTLKCKFQGPQYMCLLFSFTVLTRAYEKGELFHFRFDLMCQNTFIKCCIQIHYSNFLSNKCNVFLKICFNLNL